MTYSPPPVRRSKSPSPKSELVTEAGDLVVRATSDIEKLFQMLLQLREHHEKQALQVENTKGTREDCGRPAIINCAQAMYSAREKISSQLDLLDIPDGPAVDMLLDLLISEHAGRKVSISDTALAGRCAPTTGLRWLRILDECGLVQAEADKTDNRRRFVKLTNKGRTAISILLVSIEEKLSARPTHSHTLEIL